MLLRNTQIAYFDDTIFTDENVQALQIPVDHFLVVQVAHAEADLKCHQPDLVLTNAFLQLSLRL